jgi:uncharacterized protein YlxP (DUF503 family)
VYVGIARVDVAVGHSHSLKEKRMVIRRIKDRVRERVGVIINEVGALEVWQRGELGFAVVSAERTKVGELVEQVVRVIAGCEGAQVLAIAKDQITFEGELAPLQIDDRTGAGDKAIAADDWVPPEWTTP